MAVRFSASHASRAVLLRKKLLFPSLVIISSCVNPRTNADGRIRKIQSSGLEPATLHLVAYCFNNKINTYSLTQVILKMNVVDLTEWYGIKYY
jgi:hypothetical protein